MATTSSSVNTSQVTSTNTSIPTSESETGVWILALNTWDDAGVWLDSATWND